MGVVENVGYNQFPRQSEHLGKIVKVAFNYDFDKALYGMIVRDDCESPRVTIIRLDDGRHIRPEECQYSIC